jgi:deazaflavin-dependent oxidoreductase (nitroreductase family)
LIETRGRVTGNPATTAVGFVELPDGSLLIAAGSDESDWALNLRSDRHCSATVGEQTTSYEARELHDAERSDAISALILKYGTPAERLGRGPAFELMPGRTGGE